MNSLFTLGLMIGISVNDITVGTTIANLGMTEVKFPHPLFEGDTVHCSTEIVGQARIEVAARHAGIVEFDHRAYNQDDRLVARVPPAGLHADAAALMRSLLFVPADGGRKLDKALGCGADALIVDLEDSVAPDRKAPARASAAAFLAEAVRAGARARSSACASTGSRTGLIDADLDAVVPARPDAIMLPKAEGGAASCTPMPSSPRARRSPACPTGISRSSPSRPRARPGCFWPAPIAAPSARLIGLTWGAEDLSAELGAESQPRPRGPLHLDPIGSRARSA